MRSMTGYARISYEDDIFRSNLEIKSVNNKNLALKIKMPYNLNFLENNIRLKVSEYVTRGSVDLRIDFIDKRESYKQINYDKALAISGMSLLNEIEKSFDEKFTSKLDILIKNFSVIQKEENEIDEDEYKIFIEKKLDELLTKFLETKNQEGERLRPYFIDQLDKLKINIEKIKEFKTLVVEKHKNKLLENINKIEFNIRISEEDILKEVLIYSDRVDISEEISRFESHLDQLYSEMNSKENVIGKKIDFIIQEAFRELNTMGVKSNMYEISKIVVDSKNELEKIREQIMNIE